MSESPRSPTMPVPALGREEPAIPAAVPMAQLSALLEELDRTTAPAGFLPPVLDPQVDNQLVQVRLGIAGSLFTALRCRCAASASHSLRVALRCSGWAMDLGLEAPQRDVLEVAALLHDVGVIGVPDAVLLKPGPLDAEEANTFERSRSMSLDILRGACAEPGVLAIVRHVGAWYDGSRKGYDVAGAEIPLGARMVAVAEAFDAMTADQVFRRAISQERAVRELFACAGTQFDPELVSRFAELQLVRPSDFPREAARNWLRGLDPEAANAFWEARPAALAGAPAERDRLFESQLLDNMHDAVIFIDSSLRVVLWNHGAERLTGIAASGVRQREWSPSLLSMQNEKGEWIGEEDCPVLCAMRVRTQSLRRLTITGRGGKPLAVDSHAISVVDGDGLPAGAALLLHDASSEMSLEERCQSLHEKATKDPLTQVANRAEFDRVHEMFISAHAQRRVPCALIICDLDHFKQVNDTYGHQAGDEVIKTLAAILRSSCRAGDLVARYGGEEFVVLCADCDNATAARRAEQMRKRLGQISQPALNQQPVTASFGVTEVQAGDTPDTMLRRADRALMLAKQMGRNRVVQLGVGSDAENAAASTPALRLEDDSAIVLERNLATPVPVSVAIEKLRGFVADHRAKIVRISGSSIQLLVDDDPSEPTRRASDRPITFSVRLRFSEEQVRRADSSTGSPVVVAQTRIHVAIRAHKNRDRRRADVLDRARRILLGFRCYLIADEITAESSGGILRRVSRLLAPWLLKRSPRDPED